MPKGRLCPMCLNRRIYRAEVKTCGFKSCTRKWRQMDDQSRLTSLLLAEEKDLQQDYQVQFHPLDNSEVLQDLTHPSKAPISSTEIDKEGIEKLFPDLKDRLFPKNEPKDDD